MNKLAKAHALSRRTTFRGFDVSIETDKGEKRHWKDPHSGEEGSTLMKYPYGYLRRTEGVDGDHLDVYLGPNEQAEYVYIVHQMKAPNFKKYDEDKCMLGFNSEAEARKAYLDHYNDKRFLGSITKMSWAVFEKKAKKSFDEPKKIAGWFSNDDVINVKSDYAKGELSEQIKAVILPSILSTTANIGSLVANNIERNQYYDLLAKRGLKPQGNALSFLQEPLRREIGAPPVKVQYVNPQKDPAILFTGGTHTVSPQGEHSIRVMEHGAPSTLAHELGHSSPGRVPFTGLSDMYHHFGPAAALLAMNILNPEHALAKAMPFALTLPALPRLIEESRASIKAYKALNALRHVHGVRPASILGSLLPAFGTYALSAAAPGITAEWLRRNREKYGAEALVGGKGDGQKNENFAPAQLLKGLKVEREHTADPQTRLEIAKDHLTENDHYYDHLEKMEKKMNKTAYLLGVHTALEDLSLKQAERALGDPNYWMPEEASQPTSVEDAIQQLPASTFQGLTSKLAPDGTRSTQVKVSPQVLDNAQSIASIFQVAPEAKVEIAAPEAAQQPAGANGQATQPMTPTFAPGTAGGEQQPQLSGGAPAPMSSATGY